MIRPGGGLVENVAGAGFKGSDNPLEGIEHLAGVTGAQRLHLSANGENTLVRIARETSAYYVLGFEAQPGRSQRAEPAGRRSRRSCRRSGARASEHHDCETRRSARAERAGA